ncbi:hypothetical protein GUJ93_ZPchr0009g1948 [Zizania palustris]|uniref:Uncharacterized protein n=1 Tax=Zizania palustris TaxID=103762 RepID=A0A8J5RYC1_ZIZPA|nr:hypothetical protein GUJ93_ZPchr0009g1948 [Zizania palustris]
MELRSAKGAERSSRRRLRTMAFSEVVGSKAVRNGGGSLRPTSAEDQRLGGPLLKIRVWGVPKPEDPTEGRRCAPRK